MQAGVLRVDQVAVVAADTRIDYVFEGPISAYASIADFRVRGSASMRPRSSSAGPHPRLPTVRAREGGGARRVNAPGDDLR
jgi:hypothetical protein